jgi:hypothetical protein
MADERQVVLLLRAEAAALALVALFFFTVTGASWWLFALVILAPDLSMLGYLAGPRIGALIYNLAHIYPAPLLLGAFGWFGNQGLLLSVALIWFMHIAVDRAFGFGLKLRTGFKDTHLGRIGR